MKLRNGKYTKNPIITKKPITIDKPTVYTGEIADLIRTLKPLLDNFKICDDQISNIVQLIPIFDYLLIHVNCICNVNVNLNNLVDTITTKILSLKSELRNNMSTLLMYDLNKHNIENLKIYINFLSLIDSVNNKISENYQQFGSHKLIINHNQRFGSPDRSITPEHRFESPCVTPERFESPTRSITPKRFGSPKLITK